MNYDKLVRDYIPDLIKQDGLFRVTHVAGSEEYKDRLEAKLREEVDEFLRDSKVEELADVFEVLLEFCQYYNFSVELVDCVRKKKAKEKGCFKKRIILDSVKT